MAAAAIQPIQHNRNFIFPVQKEVLAWHLLVPLEGKLLLDDNGRLRVMGDLILWPYGYSLKTEGKKIWVIDDKGQRTVRVGDRIRLTGVNISYYTFEEKHGHPLPLYCEGPYFMVGSIDNNN